MRPPFVPAWAAVLTCALSPLAAAHDDHVHAVEEVTAAARHLAGMSRSGMPGFPDGELLPFEAPARETIDFFPLVIRDRRDGLLLGVASLEQRRAIHGLLRSVLGEEGYLRVEAVRGLEDVLRESGTTGAIRISDAYATRLFGQPSADAPWGVQYEGHHLSVNATVVGDDLRGTPLFLGANPAEVRGGVDAGLRVLAPFEDRARVFLASLTEAQRERAVVGAFDPRVTVQPGTVVPREDAEGLPARELTADQRALLRELVAAYARTLRPEFAEAALQRLDAAGLDALVFTWRGGTRPGEPCSYELNGPTVSLRFDMIADGADGADGEANHVHALWSDPQGDFGRDLLARHYAEDHGLDAHDDGHEHAAGDAGHGER